jgi:NodT family efflux transporter outer membrane factor (OMF) lipoprotein
VLPRAVFTARGFTVRRIVDRRAASGVLRQVSRRVGAWDGVAPRMLAVAALVLLCGCAVGPDFIRPAAPKGADYEPAGMSKLTASANIAGGGAQRLLRGRDIPGEWWELFRSRALRSVVEQALENNYDLQAAQAALRVARENAAVQRGAFYPQIDTDFSASRQKLPADINGEEPVPSTFNMFTGQVSVSYVPDVFGANWRAVESLDAQAEVARFQLEATYLTLTSNIVLAAVQEASLRGQIAATQKIIGIERDLLGLLRQQQQLGQIADADVVAQEAALAQVEQTLPPLQRQLDQQRHLLIALVGAFPNRKLKETFTIASFQLPRKVPLSLPASLVQHRPDVRAAEANLHSASALIGVAVANRLPNIALTANAGSTAFDFSKLFSPGTGFWTIAGNVTQPIFHGGALLHQEWAARAAFDQAQAQYRSTVIQAFQNVADALTAIRTDAVALEKAVVSERAAERSLNITRQRLQLGDINYLALLNAQQTYQQALINRVQVQASRYADTAALFQALGGGWWNRTDVQADREYPYFSIFH